MQTSRKDFLKWAGGFGLGVGILLGFRQIASATGLLPNGQTTEVKHWTASSVIAGRKAVDDYRAAEQIGKAKDQPARLEVMLSQFREQGFYSIEEFFDANKQAIKDDMARCIVYEGKCDNCEGRERGCASTCYTKHTIGEGKAELEPDHQGDGISTISYFADYYKTLPPRKKGRITPMVPRCNIMTHIVEDPALDWEWQ